MTTEEKDKKYRKVFVGNKVEGWLHQIISDSHGYPMAIIETNKKLRRYYLDDFIFID